MINRIFFFILLAGASLACNAIDKKQYPTPDKLWGDLYQEVQAANILNDPKEFWDAAPVGSKALPVLKLYEKERKKPDFDLRQFLKNNFILQDYSEIYPVSDLSFEDYVLQSFNSLLVKPKDDGGTLIPTRMRYMQGGVRYPEYNYYTSFFAVKAFQAVGEDSLASQIGTSAFQFIQDYSYVPYGNRSYYLGFTGLPVLSLIAEAIAEKQPSFLPWFGNLMAKDYQTFMAFEGDTSKAAGSKWVFRFKNGEMLNRFYSETYQTPYFSLLQSTGWVNSNRFLIDTKPDVVRFLPVDLNAVLFHYEKLLAASFIAKKKENYAASYEKLAKMRKDLVNQYLYDKEAGYYYDYDTEIDQRSKQQTLAAIYPVLVGLSNPQQTKAVVKKIEEALLSPNGLFNEVGGNLGSAELNYLTILALRKAGETALASTIKERWITINRQFFAQNKYILSTYNLKNLEESPKNATRIDGALSVLVALLNEDNNGKDINSRK